LATLRDQSVSDFTVQTDIQNLQKLDMLFSWKMFRFYCPDRHTKFAETRHAVFLENDMIRGSGASREIDLEEKRVYAPTPIIEEPYFSLPTDSSCAKNS
jgi:hypothetical protein